MAGFPTIEVDSSDVVQQQAPLHGVHVAADAAAVGTQVVVHVVQGVGHGVDGVDDKLNLPLLLVGRVLADPLLACGHIISSSLLLWGRRSLWLAYPAP